MLLFGKFCYHKSSQTSGWILVHATHLLIDFLATNIVIYISANKVYVMLSKCHLNQTVTLLRCFELLQSKRYALVYVVNCTLWKDPSCMLSQSYHFDIYLISSFDTIKSYNNDSLQRARKTTNVYSVVFVDKNVWYLYDMWNVCAPFLRPLS